MDSCSNPSLAHAYHLRPAIVRRAEFRDKYSRFSLTLQPATAATLGHPFSETHGDPHITSPQHITLRLYWPPLRRSSDKYPMGAEGRNPAHARIQGK